MIRAHKNPSSALAKLGSMLKIGCKVNNYPLLMQIFSDFLLYIMCKLRNFLIILGILTQFYLGNLLFFVAVVTANGCVTFAFYNMEDCCHRFVVGDALRVVALHDAL